MSAELTPGEAVARFAAALVLEDGTVYRGVGFGAKVESLGEVVFNTSLTGYQEIVSEPSYCGQIVVMTTTQIGNVGCNPTDMEAPRPVCAGLVCREVSPLVANWRGEQSLPAWFAEAGLVGIDEIDTRALTRHLRVKGAMRGAITPFVDDVPAVLARVRAHPGMAGLDLVPRVTCATAYQWPRAAGEGHTWRALDDGQSADPTRVAYHVVAYDFGIKENILRCLRDVGCRVTVVPATTSAADVMALAPDGVFLSNGPGDPAAVTYGIAAARSLLAHRVPLFGICLGHQIMALALGARTFKMPFGHHGGNQPVLDVATGKVEITSQNHGFAVDETSLPGNVTVSHRNLFDQSIEGLTVSDAPAFCVQYHPEASPGPHDSRYLFSRFADLMSKSR